MRQSEELTGNNRLQQKLDLARNLTKFWRSKQPCRDHFFSQPNACLTLLLFWKQMDGVSVCWSSSVVPSGTWWVSLAACKHALSDGYLGKGRLYRIIGKVSWDTQICLPCYVIWKAIGLIFLLGCSEPVCHWHSQMDSQRQLHTHEICICACWENLLR